jgi:hypothetical protein
VRVTSRPKWKKEIGRDPEVDLFALNHSDGVGNQAFVALGQESYRVKHPTQSAGGVGPAAEAEDVQTVPRRRR